MEQGMEAYRNNLYGITAIISNHKENNESRYS